jgi:DNA-binding HxlR family transcriptional regulator
MKKKVVNFNKIENCPVRNIISKLGDKWSLLILLTLHTNGIMRFNEIHKSIGEISQRMLTVTLRSLEADGLILRKVYPEIPPKVEYKLTKLSKSLMPHITNLIDWAIENTEKIMTNRKYSK